MGIVRKELLIQQLEVQKGKHLLIPPGQLVFAAEGLQLHEWHVSHLSCLRRCKADISREKERKPNMVSRQATLHS